MLKKLIVLNLAVVERAEAEFAPGLTVLTGETGAGKSVLMGALDLVLGGRADCTIVRDGAKEAEVEAVFATKCQGGEGVEQVTVRRTVTREGRSRAWINEESVTLAELKELGRKLVDIHGPTANQRLLDAAFQRELLDAGLGPKLTATGYGEAFARLTELRSQLAQLRSAGGADELDLLRFQVNELQAAGLTEADETIAARHAAAAHAEEISENATAITEGLGGDCSAAETLIRLQPHFRAVAKHLPAAAEWAAEAEELTLRMQELSRTIADAVSRLEVGEEDLDSLDRRLTLVNRLKRKYLVGDRERGVGDGAIAALLRILADKQAKLEAWEHRDERIAELEEQQQAADRAVRNAGSQLTKLRRTAAERLASAITKELRDLGFLQAKFFVALEPVEPDAHGMDRVVFMFEPNPGEAARPLAAIASSGEIARVMLALKACAAQTAQTPCTLVFDEIDANIGGETGSVVGEKLRAVAKRHQVMAITHLPQSAVYGARHLVVAKGVDGGRTRTRIYEVKGEERVSEIARMLGGEKLTSVVRKHARELLQHGQKTE